MNGDPVKRAALFDVDGTLVDTNYLHVTAWWEAFRQAGHRVPMRAVHHAIGLGGTDLIAHVLGDDRDQDQDDAISAAHKTLYGTHRERLGAFENAGRLLRSLAGEGWTIVLATSAGGAELEALRAAIDADDVITATASADDVDEGKPAAEPVTHALDLGGAKAGNSVFVGDSVWDMKSARRAGVTPVAVLSGGIPREDLSRAGAKEVYDNTSHLLSSLESSVFARQEGAG
jgi:phosphoglycolate phosphatase-like HAD superfamily hydrolase